MRNEITNYETREEAEKVAAILNFDDKLLKFCPLINGKCRRDCVCFIKASTYQPYIHLVDTTHLFRVSEPSRGFFFARYCERNVGHITIKFRRQRKHAKHSIN